MQQGGRARQQLQDLRQDWRAGQCWQQWTHWHKETEHVLISHSYFWVLFYIWCSTRNDWERLPYVSTLSEANTWKRIPLKIRRIWGTEKLTEGIYPALAGLQILDLEMSN
jgi:hypothetical protein